jgi:putative transposase
VLAEIIKHSPWLRHVFAEGGYTGGKLKDALESTKGFVVLPRRWDVERTLARLNRNRRLAKDFEQTVASAVISLLIAPIQLFASCIARL